MNFGFSQVIILLSYDWHRQSKANYKLVFCMYLCMTSNIFGVQIARYHLMQNHNERNELENFIVTAIGSISMQNIIIYKNW